MPARPVTSEDIKDCLPGDTRALVVIARRVDDSTRRGSETSLIKTLDEKLPANRKSTATPGLERFRICIIDKEGCVTTTYHSQYPDLADLSRLRMPALFDANYDTLIVVSQSVWEEKFQLNRNNLSIKGILDQLQAIGLTLQFYKWPRRNGESFKPYFE